MRAWLWKYCRRWAVLPDLQQDAWEDLLRAHSKSVRIGDFDEFVKLICMRRGARWIVRLREMAAVQDKVQVQAPLNASPPEREAGLAWTLKIVMRLPPMQRWVFLMNAVWGYGPQEIARIGGRAEATVRRTLHNARRSVRKALNEESLDTEKPF